jgi:DNA invertase Pin-like site-specific DNA recombinase
VSQKWPLARFCLVSVLCSSKARKTNLRLANSVLALGSNETARRFVGHPVAERSGWKVVRVYEDAGVSGAKGRDKRPGLDAMMKAVNAKEFDMVASWSVDRLGRSLTDLLSILQGLHEKGVGLFLHQQGLDTTTTAGKAMFQMLGVFAEFERGIIRERVNAGLARAKANGVKLGRRRTKPSVEAQIVALRAKGDGIHKIRRKLGIGTSVVQRVFKQQSAPT